MEHSREINTESSSTDMGYKLVAKLCCNRTYHIDHNYSLVDWFFRDVQIRRTVAHVPRPEFGAIGHYRANAHFECSIDLFQRAQIESRKKVLTRSVSRINLHATDQKNGWLSRCGAMYVKVSVI